jgi:peptidoglycan/LPS O-acetylase OafA/YrhL
MTAAAAATLARQKAFYRPQLDVLRFVAFAGVFLHHAFPPYSNFPSWGVPRSLVPWAAACSMAGGYGVDLFFVLSAYLITELLQREYHATGTIDVRSFYIRRILRIWPLYFAFLAIAQLAGKGTTGDRLSGSYMAAFLLLAGNWICAFKGYPKSAAAPLWSISLEEQFYLVWPAITRFVGVDRLRSIALGMIAVSFVFRTLFWLLSLQHPATWCSTLTRLDPIACGILLAVWLHGRKPMLPRRACSALWLASALSSVIVARFAPPDSRSIMTAWIGYPVVALAGTLAVYAALAWDLSTLPARAAAAGIHLGRISYGLYVFHMLAIRTAQLFHSGGTATRVLAFVLTIGLAALSYQFLERPFLQLKERFTIIRSRPV